MSDFLFRIGQLKDRSSTADGARIYIMEAIDGPLTGWKFAATSRDPDYYPKITTDVYDLHEATFGAKIATVNWLHAATRCIGAERGLPSDPLKIPQEESQRLRAILQPFRRFSSSSWQAEWTSAMQEILREGPTYPTSLRNWLKTEEASALRMHGNRKAAKRVALIFG